jgi:hypothetical protein
MQIFAAGLMALLLIPQLAFSAENRIPANARPVKCISVPDAVRNRQARQPCVGDHLIRVMAFSLSAQDIARWSLGHGLEVHVIDFGRLKRCWITVRRKTDRITKIACDR